ncbi:hypothetical protein DSM106972_020550 [Dulcicalothrix desertica PCC 7102]|uniref:DUF4351 domain-containing protein n=1 Tax=Dulcicalothrix desertica PCC 7102 TaxID=232991 RepID=A0A433VP34_9CYAN|nr:DUF4351 domain-containing protein [Dulcicalothrix desertica]RUT07795.1 hypothetical protein DSM106972_020550 [Dulcicalothrix desertica PCC 7102]
MLLSEVYQEWEEKTKQQGLEQGLEQGRQQEQRLVIENLLKARFGKIDPELASIIPSLLTLPTEEYTVLLLKPREELLAYFNQ